MKLPVGTSIFNGHSSIGSITIPIQMRQNKHRVWVKQTTTRVPNKQIRQMSRRGMHPLLMGNQNPDRKKTETKQADLTGYESAQRKRFLRTEHEKSNQNEDS